MTKSFTCTRNISILGLINVLYFSCLKSLYPVYILYYCPPIPQKVSPVVSKWGLHLPKWGNPVRLGAPPWLVLQSWCVFVWYLRFYLLRGCIVILCGYCKNPLRNNLNMLYYKRVAGINSVDDIFLGRRSQSLPHLGRWEVEGQPHNHKAQEVGGTRGWSRLEQQWMEHLSSFRKHHLECLAWLPCLEEGTGRENTEVAA